MQLSPQLFAEIVTVMRAAARGAGHESRKTTRLALESKIQVSVIRDRSHAQTIGGLSRDVSLTGIGFLITTPISREQTVVVQLLRRSDEVVHLSCSVKHRRTLADSLYIVGAEFSGIVSPMEFGLMHGPEAAELHRIQQSILV